MLFYDYHDAPNPQVVRMFAFEKGIDLPKYGVDVLGGESRRAPYITQINKSGQVPALQLDNGKVLTEILPICEYLEERFPLPSLIGETIEDRAETRMWTRWIDLKYVERMTEACVTQSGPTRDHYAAHNYKTLLPPEMSPICAEMAWEKLTWLNNEMQGRRFICGDRFSLADIHLYVFLAFFANMGFGCPRPLRWIDRFFERMAERPSASV